MMSTVLSLFPTTSQLNLASILADPLLDLLPSNLPRIPPASLFGGLCNPREPFDLPSTSLDVRAVSPEDIKCVVGQLNLQPPTLQLLRNPSRLCAVCGTGGAAPHYGGIVCGGCKIFFARAVQRRQFYICEKNGSCKMAPGKRSKCRSCRFQRCLKAKMCPEEVGKLRDLKMPESLLIPKEEGAVVAYFDHAVLQNTLGDQRTMLEKQFAKEYSSTSQIRSVVRTFINAERSCDNSSCTFPVPEKIFCSLSETLSAALRNPMSVCERTPVHWEKAGKTPFEGGLEKVRQVYCRLVVHYLEFLQSVEDLYQLKEKQRMNLVSSRMCPVLLLTLAHNTYKYESDGLLVGDFEIRAEDLPEKLAKRFLDSARSQLVKRMKEIDMTEEEYVLLKLITLFTMADPLSCEDAQATVRTLRFKHERFLISFIQDEYPDWEKEKISARVQSMLEMINVISKLSHLPSLLLILTVSLNVANLRDRLSYDLHIRRYD